MVFSIGMYNNNKRKYTIYLLLIILPTTLMGNVLLTLQYKRNVKCPKSQEVSLYE